MLHCASSAAKPRSSNSRRHHVRAKKPRMSRCGSSSTMNAPSRPVGEKIIGTPTRRVNERPCSHYRCDAGACLRCVHPIQPPQVASQAPPLLQLLNVLDAEEAVPEKLVARQ